MVSPRCIRARYNTLLPFQLDFESPAGVWARFHNNAARKMECAMHNGMPTPRTTVSTISKFKLVNRAATEKTQKELSVPQIATTSASQRLAAST